MSGEKTELENARQVIRELREEKTDREKAWAEETRALEQCEKDRVKADEEIARLDAELEKESRTVKSIARMLGWENVPPQKTIENDLSALKARMERSVQECENTQRLIKELRRELEAQASRVREAEARAVPDKGACQAAREEAEKLRADIAGLELELDAVRSALKADDDLLAEERKVFMEFIQECAVLLGFPKLADCGEYGGDAIRHGIEKIRQERDCAVTTAEEEVLRRRPLLADIAELKKKLDVAELTADGVVEGAAEWEDDCKTAQKQVKELDHTLGISVDHAQKSEQENLRLRGALEKINEIRNDVIGRANVNWSAHIYPLVAALDEAGFEGAGYEKARERVEATIKAAREMAAGAWGQEATKDTVMDVHLAEEFAEILFPFLETLEFYALPGHWQMDRHGFTESVCERDLGGRARATLGRPDRDVPEITDVDDVAYPVGAKTCANCGNCKIDEEIVGVAELAPPMPYRMRCSKSVFASCGENGSFEHWDTDDGESPVSRARGRPCCSPQCTKDAEWVIVSGPTVDDCWEACTVHIGELLPDAQELRVYPVSKAGDVDVDSGTGGGPNGDGT